MKYIKENWKFLLFVIIVGIVGSIFTVIYQIDSRAPELIEEAIKQNAGVISTSVGNHLLLEHPEFVRL